MVVPLIPAMKVFFCVPGMPTADDFGVFLCPFVADLDVVRAGGDVLARILADHDVAVPGQDFTPSWLSIHWRRPI